MRERAFTNAIRALLAELDARVGERADERAFLNPLGPLATAEPCLWLPGAGLHMSSILAFGPMLEKLLAGMTEIVHTEREAGTELEEMLEEPVSESWIDDIRLHSFFFMPICRINRK
jgi:hypothetical protein